jgi:hypothetical protein
MALPLQTTTAPRVTLLNADTTANNTAAVTRQNHYKHFLQIISPGTAVTVTVQVSVDGVNWLSLASGGTLTGNAYLYLDGYYPYIQVTRDNSTNSVTVILFSGWFQA